MLRLLCLAFCATVALGNVLKDTCQVGDWSEWSDCTKRVTCEPYTGANIYDMPPTDPRLATVKRELNMKRKLLADLEAAACRAAGSGCARRTDFLDSIWERENCVDGVTSSGFNCNNVDMLAMISMDDLGYDTPISPDTYEGRTGSDMWGWRDEEFGEDYVVVGLSGGSSFVRVTDPENPVVLAFLPTHTDASNWRDMKVMGHWAYIVSEARNHGIQAFNMHQLRDWNSYQGWLDSSSYSHYDGIGQSHNIGKNEETGYLFVVGAYAYCNGGLHMVDARNGGDQLTFAGCFSEDGYVHDVECVVYHGPDSRYTDREICFGYNENSLTIVDVTNKANAQMISRTGYVGSQYTHQGWITEDHTTILMDDELDELYTSDKYTKTYVWDVRNLNQPSLINICRSHLTSIDHNQYIVKGLSYQSNYQAGVRIQSIDQDNFELTEVASFQTTLSDPISEFGYGTWTNYPYFIDEGEDYPKYVPASCKEYGMFLLEPNYAAMLSSNTPNGIQHRTRDIMAEGSNCPALKETRVC